MIKLLQRAIRGARNEILYSGNNASGALSSPNVATPSGKSVTAKTALESSVAYDCVRKNSQVLSSLPLAQYEKDAKGGRVKVEDDLSSILTSSPNPDQTALEFWEGMTAQLLLRGNAYAERLFIRNRLVGLRPLFNVTPKRKPNGAFEYQFYDRGQRATLPADKVFHIRGFGPGDGLGMSVVAYGAASMGAALAADETAASVFSNRMFAGGVLTSDQGLTPKQRADLGEILNQYAGSKRAGKLMVLEAGLKYSALQLNPDDAQLLETRRYSVEDICRWFGTPPIVVGHSAEGQTMWGSGIEAILISWLTLGINPLANRIEHRIRKDLITPGHRSRRYFEFNREAMLQMDSKSKSEFLSKMGQSATMTANERRAKLNLPRHDDPQADMLLAQTALAPLETLGKDTK